MNTITSDQAAQAIAYSTTGDRVVTFEANTSGTRYTRVELAMGHLSERYITRRAACRELAVMLAEGTWEIYGAVADAIEIHESRVRH